MSLFRSPPPLLRPLLAAALLFAGADTSIVRAQDAAPAAAASPDPASAPAANTTATPAAADTPSIETSVAVQMANAHDPETLYPELFTLPDQRTILFLGFGTPAGRDFLLQKIADPAVPRDRRLVLAQALRAAGPVYQSKFTNITPTSWGIQGNPDDKNSSYLTHVAQLIAAHAELALALLDALSWQAVGSPASRDPQLQADWDAATDLLAQLYPQTKSEPERYAIEQLALQLGGTAFGKLHSKSGPVLSMVTQAVPSQPTQTPGTVNTGPVIPTRVIDLVVNYDYQSLPGADRITKAAIVLEPLHPGPEYVFTQRLLPFSATQPEGKGSLHVVLPLTIVRTQYRVFFRFLAGDEVVSEGHGITVQL
jgi:hypothetical protein